MIRLALIVACLPLALRLLDDAATRLEPFVSWLETMRED